MTGTEKIVGRIKLDSAQKCENMIAQARQQAAQITEKAAAEGEALSGGANEIAKNQADEIIRMAVSAAQQKAGQIILAARIEALNEALNAAAGSFRDMPADEYFSALSALAIKNAMPGTGEMRLSERDLKRLPPQFEAKINESLTEKVSSVKIGGEPAAIDDGFILVYGDVEINCTISALIEASRDELKEKICGIIF